MYLVSARHLFTVSRATASASSTIFALSLPVLAMAWVLVGAVVLLAGGRRGAWMRVLLVVLTVTVVVCVVMTHAGLMLALPRPYAVLQFSYRLESYVLLGVSGAVLAVLVLLQDGARTRGTRLLTAALPVVLCVSVVGAIQQTDATPTGGNRATALKSYVEPPIPEVLKDYVHAKLPFLAVSEGRASEVEFSPGAVRDDRLSAVVHLPPGQVVYSDIAGGPELVRVSGARIVGVDPEFNDVLEIGSGKGSSRHSTARRRAPRAPAATIALSPAGGLPVVLGRLLTLAAAIFLAGEFAALAVRRLRARRV